MSYVISYMLYLLYVIFIIPEKTTTTTTEQTDTVTAAAKYPPSAAGVHKLPAGFSDPWSAGLSVRRLPITQDYVTHSIHL